MDYEPENGSRYEGTLFETQDLSSLLLFSFIHSWKHLILIPSWYADEAPRYEQRDRSASPRPSRRDDSPRGASRRSASPNGNGNADSRLVYIYASLKVIDPDVL